MLPYVLLDSMTLISRDVFRSLQEIAESHKQLTEAFNQQAQRYNVFHGITWILSLCLRPNWFDEVQLRTLRVDSKTFAYKWLLQKVFEGFSLRDKSDPLQIKKKGVGLLVVTVWLEVWMTYSSSCHHHFHHP